jgi:hypothetical protein
LRTALRRSGATAHEAQHFTQALRARMKHLESVAFSRRARLQSLVSHK